MYFFNIFLFILLFYMCEYFAYMYVKYTMCVSGAHKGQNRALDSLELELHPTREIGHMTRSSARAASTF